MRKQQFLTLTSVNLRYANPQLTDKAAKRQGWFDLDQLFVVSICAFWGSVSASLWVDDDHIGF